MIRAVLFDMIGTTVIEKDPETINNCFLKAFSDNNVMADRNLFKTNRGKDKLEIINLILNNSQQDVLLAESIYNSFKNNVEDNLENFTPAEDVDEVINFLRQKDIKVGLGTGLSRDLFQKIFARVGWHTEQFDYIGISAEVGRSRPDPAMILDMMHELNIKKPKEFLKVGDTTADIQEGKNANVVTAVILNATQSKEQLIAENPDFIIHHLTEIQHIIDVVVDKYNFPTD